MCRVLWQRLVRCNLTAVVMAMVKKVVLRIQLRLTWVQSLHQHLYQ